MDGAAISQTLADHGARLTGVEKDQAHHAKVDDIQFAHIGKAITEINERQEREAKERREALDRVHGRIDVTAASIVRMETTLTSLPNDIATQIKLSGAKGKLDVYARGGAWLMGAVAIATLAWEILHK
jgi:hypothetical protein